MPHVNNFGQSLVEKLEGKNNNSRINLHKNVIISPFSINSALLVAAAGANGTTFSEFVRVLHIKGIHNSESVLTNKKIVKTNHEKTPFISANSAWINAKVDVYKNYTDSVQRSFNSPVFSSDFSSDNIVLQINSWISDKTYGVISNAIQKVSPETAMLLVNALYFKGEWKNPFEPKESATERFNLLDSESWKAVRFMHAVRKGLYYTDSDIDAAVLPFSGGPQLMVIKPHRRGAKGLDLVVKTCLSHSKIDHILFTAKNTKLNLALPHFNISHSFSPVEQLKQLGLVCAFSKDRAEFPFISDMPLYVSDVMHQVVFSLDETGVKAAAATEVVIKERSFDKSKYSLFKAPVPFYVDRPFVFVLLDGRTALFMGVIRDVDPNSPVMEP